MAARRRRKTRRRAGPRQVSILKSLETFSLLSIMTKGLTGYGPWQFITSTDDLGGMQ